MPPCDRGGDTPELLDVCVDQTSPLPPQPQGGGASHPSDGKPAWGLPRALRGPAGDWEWPECPQGVPCRGTGSPRPRPSRVPPRTVSESCAPRAFPDCQCCQEHPEGWEGAELEVTPPCGTRALAGESEPRVGSAGSGLAGLSRWREAVLGPNLSNSLFLAF